MLTAEAARELRILGITGGKSVELQNGKRRVLVVDDEAAMRDSCQPISIGWLKLIGTASISLVYLRDASDYPLIAVAGIGCFVMDVMYVRLITAKALPSGTK